MLYDEHQQYAINQVIKKSTTFLVQSIVTLHRKMLTEVTIGAKNKHKSVARGGYKLWKRVAIHFRVEECEIRCMQMLIDAIGLPRMFDTPEVQEIIAKRINNPVVGATYFDEEEDLLVTVTRVFAERVYYTGQAVGDATIYAFNKQFKPVFDASDDLDE